MTRVFLSIAAAEGNLGDVFIRRENLLQYDSIGLTPFMYVGGMSADYIDAVVGDREWEGTSSARTFVSTLLSDLVHGRRPVVAMAPGPIVVGSSVATTIKHSLLLALFSTVRLLGGSVVVQGRSLDVKRAYGIWLERLFRALANFHSVRDDRSNRLLGGQTQLVPDFGFQGYSNRSPAVGDDRPSVVVSLRADRELSEEFVLSLASRAAAMGLQVQFVVQVREDGPINTRAAVVASAEFVDWPTERAHAAQESILEHAYERASIVVSDRLHVLILAARHGAVPVILRSGATTKLTDALQWILTPRSVSVLDSSGLDGFDSYEERKRLHLNMLNANQKLTRTARDVRDALSTRPFGKIGKVQ